ncbi:MAG TPA: hypothetical protein VII76_11235 [Acidimicrobiales bacterium]
MAKVTALATVAMAVAALGGGVASATTVHVQSDHQITGTVGSVDDSSVAGTCGAAGEAGDFSLNQKGGPSTVDVEVPSTTFKEKGVGAPSFANVCVGSQVRALGAASTSDVVTASEVVVTPARAQQASGTVAAVDGASTAGACGTTGTAGDFVLTTPRADDIVDVAVPSTTFKDRGVSTPSFADVCVGAHARVVGTISADGSDAAAVVVVVPPRPRVSGIVTAVNGTSSSGACGTADEPGAFSLNQKGTTYTVEVGNPPTSFQEHGMSTPTFADVCVGSRVSAIGTVSSDDDVAATEVVVVPPPAQHVSGLVAAVNGTSSSGSCGTAGADGDFVLQVKSTPFTVEVRDLSTTFKENGVRQPSFADVCVGAQARVIATISSDDVVTATQVVVIPPRTQQVSGTVASVNGTSTCGKSGTAGAFIVTARGSAYTVNVGNPSTTFQEHGVPAPSFAMVCTGDKVRARGTVTGDKVVTATDVLVIVPPK